MTIGTTERFRYYNTYYKPVNTTSDVLINKPQRINDISECETVASDNNSKIFVVSNWNNTTQDFSCAYQNPVISTTKFDNWVSSLIKCESSSCNEVDSNDNYIGLNDNISLYGAPNYNLSYIEDYNETTSYTKDDFDTQVTTIENNLKIFLGKLNNYLVFYYMYVNVDGNNITFGDKDNEHQEYSNSLNEAQTNLETSLKSLDSMFKDTLEYTEKINSRCMQNYNLILDMNNRVSTAKKYFNLVMNQNQGAIGELDINEYNRNQAIFENLVLITVLLIVIYLYFKNSN